MPRARVEREVKNDGTWKTIEIETATGRDEEPTVTVEYTIPATAQKFQEMVLSLVDTNDDGAFWYLTYHRAAEDPGKLPSPLEFVYQHFVNSVDKAQRASVYVSTPAKTTLISVGSGQPKFDLITVPPARLIVGINGMRGKRASDLMMLGIVDPNAPENTEKVRSVDRKLNTAQFEYAAELLVERGQAKENAASGMLEAVAA